MKKPRRSGAKFLAGCRNASNGNPPTPYHIGCTAFGRLAPVDKMMPRGSHSNPGSRRAVGAAPPPATAAPRHSTTSELACVSVDASLRHCCAAVPHINANLRNISRCCHSVACSAASMRSLVNQSTEDRLHREAPRDMASAVDVRGARVSRGGFYAWLTRPRSQRSRDDDELGAKVRACFLGSDRTYGARRVWRDLLTEGISCGLHRIERLMRLQAIKARPAAPPSARSGRHAPSPPMFARAA